MDDHKVVTAEEWLIARRKLLVREKEFTRLRDQLSQERRDLPWVKIDKEYIFDGPDGKETLSDLFEGRSQLLIYHFMFDPSWDEGCPMCSFWADNYDGIIVHLKQRDVTMVTISRAPLDKLEEYKKRMGWKFKWLSSYESDFNYDYHVSFTPQELAKGEAFYNFRTGGFDGPEGPGISVFYKNEKRHVFHTYSCYARGLDMLNDAYHFLDLVPKGRDEGGLGMEWVRRHDTYGG
jgi:predicted dithiol-disulfide oxidoreductase (DUF899 family)